MAKRKTKKPKKKANKKLSNRIKERMDELGYNDEDVARLVRERFGTNTQGTSIYRLRMEAPDMTLTVPWLDRLAAVLDCERNDLLLDGPTSEEGRTVPVVGYVGAGEEVFNFESPGEIDRIVPESRRTDVVAVRVRGRSMVPKYEPNALLFYKETDYVTPDCIGRSCVVHLRDGRTFVKKLRSGPRPGEYILVSLVGPDIMDVDIAWAARVLYCEEP